MHTTQVSSILQISVTDHCSGCTIMVIIIEVIPEVITCITMAVVIHSGGCSDNSMKQHLLGDRARDLELENT